MKKNLLYTISCLAFIIVIGGAVYEHLNVVPTWSAAPPYSLSMFQGKYGLDPSLFWKLIHPINLLLFAIALILHWKTTRRKHLLIVTTGYVLILCITFIYFVPELISITTTPFSETINDTLVARATAWETGSLIRLAVLFLLAVTLLMGLTKNEAVKK